ncbi:glycosyl transferase [Cellulomonas sp. JZ18]|uniref:glycosyl transferase n=1 Tax=Cellulomonas sp. JZ18 TaxID=2654191 RepID=UPI0012D487AE|nr:glycosyl transferase [Cellulomonas sp. JZ18]QGQ20152.1 glycosyl transferase [Cellulomonas sp. JZ18]
MARGRTARLRVLQSFREPRTTTNPYLVQLRDALAPHADVATFRWSRALAGRYDVLHVHWPEVVVDRGTRVRRWAATAAFALVVLRASTGGRVLVRTVHNVQPHERPHRATAAVTRWCDRRTGWWIRLNDRTPVPDPARASTVPHGDYATWFASYPAARPVPGRLVSVGLVRAYKGVEDLVAAVRATPPDGLDLVVAGRAATPAVADAVRAAAGDDPRVRLDLRHVDDEQLVAEVTAAELVVLPYRAMHNSGAALLALSLARPVLVPDGEVVADLAAEVGPAWVRRFTPPLTSQTLREEVAALRADPPAGAPDLRARRWDRVAEGHVRAYEAALAAARGRSRS